MPQFTEQDNYAGLKTEFIEALERARLIKSGSVSMRDLGDDEMFYLSVHELIMVFEVLLTHARHPQWHQPTLH